jgi:hypothetical protein
MVTGFAFLSRLTQIVQPHTRFVFPGAGIHLGLPSHPASPRRSCLRPGVSTTSSPRGLSPPSDRPCRAYSKAPSGRRCAIGVCRPWTRRPLTRNLAPAGEDGAEMWADQAVVLPSRPKRAGPAPETPHQPCPGGERTPASIPNRSSGEQWEHDRNHPTTRSRQHPSSRLPGAWRQAAL